MAEPLHFVSIAGAPFGCTCTADLSGDMDARAAAALREALRSHKLVHFTGQRLTRERQSQVLGAIGHVLAGDAPEISIDGTLGGSTLAFHSDLAFTHEPIETLSLHALDVEDDATSTLFANGVRAAAALPPDLRARIVPLTAIRAFATMQSERALPHPLPDLLPREERPVLIRHPATGEEILYVSEMHTASLEGVPHAEGEALLARLFAILYAEDAVYRHRWRRGDLVIWDNLALQHARPSLAGVARRRLQRASVARHTFDELLPGFRLSDHRIMALGKGQSLALPDTGKDRAVNDIPYLLRGVQPVATESSTLVSSSKFLNNPFLRDWLPMILLRKVGPDLPPPAEMYGVGDQLSAMRDLDRIEEMITAERRINPRFDAWFEERFISDYTIEEFAKFQPGSVGRTFYDWLTGGNYDIQIRPWFEPKTQFDFYQLRAGQTHDFEHIITGGEFTYVGELVPYWMRLTNLFQHLQDQELAAELVQIYIFGQLRYTVRTVLHYPYAWLSCVEAIQSGIHVGLESEPIFMMRYEPVFHLPIAEAREVLGVRGATDRDTRLAGEIMAGRGGSEEMRQRMAAERGIPTG